MASNVIARSAELNNRAVVHLVNGQFESAMRTLACALQTAKLQMDKDVEENWQMPVNLDKVLLQSPAIHCKQCIINHQKQGKAAYIYDRPVTIPTCDITGKVVVSSTLCGTIVIFNLALTYHLGANRSCKRNTYLKKAARLYELAYSLRKEDRGNILGSSVLFETAAINNLGLVHEALNQAEKARHCFQHVLSTMMCLIDCDNWATFEREPFIHNATMFVLQDVGAAAA